MCQDARLLNGGGVISRSMTAWPRMAPWESRNCRVHVPYSLISTQVHTRREQPKHEVVEFTSVFCAGTGVAAEASGQNALSCWGSSAPGGASIYSTSMQMPTVSKASTWPGSNGAGSSHGVVRDDRLLGGAGGGEASRITSSSAISLSQSSTVCWPLALEFLRSHWSRRRFILVV